MSVFKFRFYNFEQKKFKKLEATFKESESSLHPVTLPFGSEKKKKR